MAGEDQERFEDYLELEHYLEELQAGHVAHPPEELTPAKARIYRIAALFRSASPEESEPRPEFAAELKERLEQELQEPTKPPSFPFLPGSASRRPQRATRRPERRLNISRRALLAGSAAAAASLVAGASIGAGIEEVQEEEGSKAGTPGVTGWSSTLVNEGQGTWHFVTSLADLKDQALRFATDTIIGYVIRNDGDDPGDPAPVVAVSAACTHMGCIVQWQDSDRKFHCPCHGGLFTEYGKTDTGAPLRYLKPLPRLKTHVDEAGRVFVEVPESQRSPKVTSWVESK